MQATSAVEAGEQGTLVYRPKPSFPSLSHFQYGTTNDGKLGGGLRMRIVLVLSVVIQNSFVVVLIP